MNIPAAKTIHMMAVPDAEYDYVWHKLDTLQHLKGIWTCPPKKPRTFFTKKDGCIYATQVVDGKRTRSKVEPLSRILKEQEKAKKQYEDSIAKAGGEREFIIQEFLKKNPEWDREKCELEADLVFEMRKSVRKVSEDLKCSPEEAYKILQQGLMIQSLKAKGEYETEKLNNIYKNEFIAAESQSTPDNSLEVLSEQQHQSHPLDSQSESQLHHQSHSSEEQPHQYQEQDS